MKRSKFNKSTKPGWTGIRTKEYNDYIRKGEEAYWNLSKEDRKELFDSILKSRVKEQIKKAMEDDKSSDR